MAWNFASEEKRGGRQDEARKIGAQTLLVTGCMRAKFKRRILAIDDEPGVTQLVQRVFEETKCYTVFTENDPHQAIEAARRTSPDLILMDINMPGQSGRQIAKNLRKEPGLRYRPIIFFTSMIVSTGPVDISDEHGRTEMLSKTSTTLRQLSEAVNRLLAK